MAVKREKVVQTAEKYVQRGKIDAAIREYRKVLAEQPDDATTLNRVGDLYARTERPDEAIKLFTQIAENYTADGFFPKATAIYKKIIKLDPTRLEVYEKLAELYHRQGLLTEARTQYQVLADYYLKHDNSTSAISIYERMAKVDPEDPRLRVRLAELYQRGKLLDKAMAQYRRIAELMLAHGHADEAEQVLLKGLDVDGRDIGFITDGVLKLKEAGHVAAAARFLAAAVERNPEAEKVARMVGVEAPAAAPEAETAAEEPYAAPDTARAVAEPPVEARSVAAPSFAAPDAEEPDFEEPGFDTPDFEGAGRADGEVDLVLEVDDEPDLSEALESAARAVDEPGAAARRSSGAGAAFTEPDPPPAEAAGFAAAQSFLEDQPFAQEEPGEITLDLDFDLDDDEAPASLVRPPADVLEADARSAAGAAAPTPEAEPEDEESDPAELDLDLSAPELPEIELPEVEPAGEPELDAELEGAASGVVDDARATPAAPPKVPAEDDLDLDFLERTAAELHPERIQQEEDLVTEAEVLVKYGLTEKAMERLSELMQLNPEHPGGLGLLIRLHLDEGQYDGAAELASQLCQLAPRSDAWQDLWERLERTGFLRTEEGVILPPGADEEEADTTPGLAPPVVDSEDLLAPGSGLERTGTWAAAEEAAREAAELPLGLDFGVGGLADEASEGESSEGAAADEVHFEETSAGEPGEAPPAAQPPPPASSPESPQAASGPATGGRRGARDVDDLLASLAAEVLPRSRRRSAATGEDTASGVAPVPSKPAGAPSAAPPASPRAAAPAPASGAVPPAEPPAPPPPAEPSPDWLDKTPAQAASTGEGALFSDEDDFFDLAAELEEELSREGELEEDDDLLLEQPREQSLEEIVEGFKKGVSENLSQEDHHTHFDLGIAYREMGLLDEAIGEFQVAAKSPDLLVECCSMLGLSFLEKGLPELAIKWYRRGLDAPGLDEDRQLGLLYDLGNAFMAMGEREEAHRTFVDLYGTNSNYRDVVAKLEETRRR